MNSDTSFTSFKRDIEYRTHIETSTLIEYIYMNCPIQKISLEL